MAEHVLKTWSPFFDAMASGLKTFEVRKNDRGFQAGDLLVLQKYDPDLKMYVDSKGTPTPVRYLAATLRKRVTYVLSGMGLSPEFVVMGLAPEEEELPGPSEGQIQAIRDAALDASEAALAEALGLGESDLRWEDLLKEAKEGKQARIAQIRTGAPPYSYSEQAEAPSVPAKLEPPKGWLWGAPGSPESETLFGRCSLRVQGEDLFVGGSPLPIEAVRRVLDVGGGWQDEDAEAPEGWEWNGDMLVCEDNETLEAKDPHRHYLIGAWIGWDGSDLVLRGQRVAAAAIRCVLGSKNKP